MNDKYSTTEGKTSEKLSDEAMLSAQWKNIDWHKAEREVNRLQIRIVKATQQKDYNAVKRLQYLLTHSFYAKALAVKRVVTNDGRRTPGVDGVLWNTPVKKMAAALSLTDKRYRARPLRRVYIEKKDKKKKRPLGIPTMYDRAMQALYALALEPVAETTADGKSFGFRKGRCAQDACEYLFNALSRKRISPKWVLEGDIKGCFDHISHDWLLANIPMDKNILKQFLKAGFIYQRELFPTEEGTPQGGIISPILANMTLDGIEKKLVERFHTNALGKVDSRFKNAHKVNFVRYADDFVVTAATPELALEAKELIREFLAERGWKTMERKMLGELLSKQKEPAVLPDVQEQRQCSVAGAELKESQTSAPKHFTEDTLLHAMETASADSMPEGVERQGIGTPATRAATIEKLVQKGFLERKGSKKTKVLLPTDKGKALITVMPEEIQSPEMTADWETKLLRIERGEMEPNEFMTEIKEMISSLVTTTEARKGANALMKNKVIGVCPNCGKSVVEREKGWFCENRECRFVLWKDNAFFKRLGKRLDAHAADKLLRDGRVRLKDCKSAKGKTYNATVLLSCEADGRSKFSLEFEGGC